MLAAQLINDLFNNAGITDTETRDKIAQIKDLSTIEIPDEDAGKIIGKDRLTLEAARNNQDLKKHFTALALNGFDTKLSDMVDAYGLNDQADTFKAEQSTYKRMGLLLDAYKGKLEKDLKAGKGDNKELIDKINILEAQVANEKKTWETEREGLLNQHTSTLNKMGVDNMLRAYKYAYDMPTDDMVMLASNKLHSALEAKELQYSQNGSGLKLSQKDGSDYYDGSKKIELKDFIDGILAENKLLATTDTNQTSHTSTQTQSQSNGGGDWDEAAAKAQAAYDAANQ